MSLRMIFAVPTLFPGGGVVKVLDYVHHALALGCRAVLLKGGQLEGDVVVDLLATRDGSEEFESPRIRTRSTHGTGCTLASAIATGLAQTLPLRDAVVRARDYVHRAIMTAPKFGRGHGPLNHAHPLEA